MEQVRPDAATIAVTALANARFADLSGSRKVAVFPFRGPKNSSAFPAELNARQGSAAEVVKRSACN